MKPKIWLRRAAQTWLETATDDMGTLDISRIAKRTDLRPETVLFGDLGAYEGITIAEVRDVCGSTAGESKESAVLVDGYAAAHTEGENLRENQAKRLKHADTREVDVGEGLSSEFERELQNFWRSLDKAEMKHLPIQNANMEADEIPDGKATVKVLELKDNPLMEGISRIMVPEFYDELWECAVSSQNVGVSSQNVGVSSKNVGVSSKNVGVSSKNVGVVITGTPGTGKSVMGWYFIYKLRMQRGLFNLVYQHQRSGDQFFFSEKGIVTRASTVSDKFAKVLDSRDTVYVVDGTGVLSKRARTFVFTSPNPRSYNEYLKDGNKIFYSKVWSKSEILAARQLLFKDIDERHVLELYGKWGGVPRHVLENAEDENWQEDLESKVQSVSGSQWLDFLTNLGSVGRADRSTMPDVVMHYTTEDYIKYKVVLASSYVSQLAYSTLHKHSTVQTLQFLRSTDPTSASARGILFERFAHNVLGRKCNVRVRSLEEGGHSKIESLEWPLLKRRTFQILSSKGDLVEEGSTGCYWEPESKNNAAFDAVCSNIGDDLGTVAALQMTVSKKHGIQHAGLVKLVEAAPSVKRLYFVVPGSIFEEFQKQPFTNKQRVSKKDLNERTLPPSDSVSGVEQWALEVDLDHAPPDS